MQEPNNISQIFTKYTWPRFAKITFYTDYQILMQLPLIFLQQFFAHITSFSHPDISHGETLALSICLFSSLLFLYLPTRVS